MTGSSGRAGRLALALVLALVVAGLAAAGQGSLAPPPLDDLGGWLEARGTLVAAMAALRLLGLAAAAWLLLVTVVAEVATAVGAVRLLALTERAVPPAARRALGAVVGVGAAVAGVGATVGPSAAGSVAPPPAVARQQAEPVDDAGSRPPRPHDQDAAVATLSVAPAPPPVTDAPPPPTAAETRSVEEWTVEPGDSFWSIARDVVAERRAGPPSEAEVAGYWRALVAANGDRLLGGEPDLIFPGQRLVLPG